MQGGPHRGPLSRPCGDKDKFIKHVRVFLPPVGSSRVSAAPVGTSRGSAAPVGSSRGSCIARSLLLQLSDDTDDDSGTWSLSHSYKESISSHQRLDNKNYCNPRQERRSVFRGRTVDANDGNEKDIRKHVNSNRASMLRKRDVGNKYRIKGTKNVSPANNMKFVYRFQGRRIKVNGKTLSPREEDEESSRSSIVKTKSAMPWLKLRDEPPVKCGYLERSKIDQNTGSRVVTTFLPSIAHALQSK